MGSLIEELRRREEAARAEADGLRARIERPLTEDVLAQRLHVIGIGPRQGRSTALFTLAAEVPAAILAETLGIHVQAAIQWQKISAGDWAACAADVSRRTSHIL